MQIRPSPQRKIMSVKFNELTTAEKIIAITLALSVIYIENWIFMIAIGTLHSAFNFIPALGFWATFACNVLLAAVIRFVANREFRVTK